jgi:SM-20-related protein
MLFGNHLILPDMQTTLEIQFAQIADDLSTNGYTIIDHFLSPDEIDAILGTDEFLHRMLQFHKAGIGKEATKQINEGVRGDLIQWIDPALTSPPIRLYMDRIQALIRFVNQELFLSLKDAEIHMTAYPVGAFYKRHLDQFRADSHRKLSAICYLNQNWSDADGGQLRLYLPDGDRDVLPEAGRFVCFRSDQIEHEVLPAKRERLSLTGWLTDKAAV